MQKRLIYKFLTSTSLFQNFEVTKVFEIFILLQTVLFLTDSVFFAVCACFDDSMVFFDEFLPYKSWNIVDIMQKQNNNRFATELIVVVCFLILTNLMKVLFEFCVIEVFKFWVILRWMKE